MMSKTEAAYLILTEEKHPLHVKEIISIALSRNLIQTKGKTPATTLNADLTNENKRRTKKGKSLRFVRIGNGIWALSEWYK